MRYLGLFAAVASVILPSGRSVRAAEYEAVPRTVIGVVNWDCSLPSETWFGKYATTSLSPSKFRHATPFYADVKGPDSIDYHWRTVEEYEREMQYAIDAGIDYFAYCWYGEMKDGKDFTPVAKDASSVCDPHVWELATARQLHARSRLREQLKMCAILVTLHPLADAEIESLARTMKEPWYQTVQGRPLLYLFGGKGSNVLTRVRAACRKIEAKDPYAVVMTVGGERFDGIGEEGVQAISCYTDYILDVDTFDEVVAGQIARNAGRAATGMDMIPTFTLGWDPRPRVDHPVPWVSYPNVRYMRPATGAEWLDGARKLARWIGANRVSCPTGHVLAFAWNEFEEGGWICPTWRPDGKPDTSRVESFRKVGDFLRRELDNLAYDEPQRAQFHFTPRTGWMNDPHGLTFYKGEWHLFHQANPAKPAWEDAMWGHAVSKDLLHWRQLPLALVRDEYGAVYSGSATIDHDNVAGFGKDELLLFYTAAGDTEFTQRMAHSPDGRAFTKVAGDPVLAVQGLSNRDPHVFRYHDGRWVMVLFVPLNGRHNFIIYNSTDLRHWKQASIFAGPKAEDVDFYDWEVPHLFELPIEGTNERRWVLMGASGVYSVGTFDGATFVAEARGLPAVVKAEPGGNWPKPNWPKFGYNCYSPFSGNEDGRTIMMAWYHLNTRGEAFTQAAGLPLETKLLPTQDGPRMAFFPARELKNLRLGPAVPLERFEGELLEAEVSCRVMPGSRVTYSFRGIPVTYDRNFGTLTIAGETVPWHTQDGALRLHVFQDRIGLEVFDPSGLQAFVQPKAFPTRANRWIVFSVEGRALDDTSSVWRLASIHE